MMRSAERIASLYSSAAAVKRKFGESSNSLRDVEALSAWARALGADMAFVGKLRENSDMLTIAMPSIYFRDSSARSRLLDIYELSIPYTRSVLDGISGPAVLNDVRSFEEFQSFNKGINLGLGRKTCNEVVLFFWVDAPLQLSHLLNQYGSSIFPSPPSAEARVGAAVASVLTEGVEKWVNSHTAPDKPFLAVGSDELTPSEMLVHIRQGSQTGELLAKLLVQTAIDDLEEQEFSD